MAGKHRKSSRPRSTATRRGGTGLAAAAVSATTMSAALVTGTTTAVAPSIELMALVTPSNSTSQFFAGTTYYGKDYTTEYGQQQVVPFLLGPQGIVDAIDANATDSDGTVVLSSGWGAGQTGTALAIMKARPGGSPANVKLVILDNDSNFPAGGFWTTYYPFAPLLFTSAEPTPKFVDVPVVDTAYEYNVNSSAPTYPINLISVANTLVAYVYGYGGEETAPMPDEALAAKPSDALHYHYVVAPDGQITHAYALAPGDGNVTYVTFEADGLPLLRPLRLIPGGDILADTLEPALTEIVNAGYKDNNPIAENPTEIRPMGLLPTSETATMLNRLPDAIETGLKNGAATAQADFASPANFVTKPLAEAAKLPGISSLPTSQLSTSQLSSSKLTTNAVVPKEITPKSTKKVSPGLDTKGAAASSDDPKSDHPKSDHPKPLKRLAEKVRTKAADGPSATAAN